MINISDALADVVSHIEVAYKLKSGEINGMATGFTDFDMFTLGLQPGTLNIVAGRPSMGKSSFALNIAQHVALQLAKTVAIFSLDQSCSQVALRMMASVGKINCHTLRSGRLDDSDWILLTEALGKMNELPIFIDDTSRLNAQALADRARKMNSSTKLDLIVVNSLQLFTSDNEDDIINPAKLKVEAAIMLKALAQELNIPILLTSQVSRNVENRRNHRPTVVDLREDVAPHADVIIFIYRDEVYTPESPDKGIAEIFIAKNKNGPTGWVRLKFVGEYSSFENIRYDAI